MPGAIADALFFVIRVPVNGVDLVENLPVESFVIVELN